MVESPGIASLVMVMLAQNAVRQCPVSEQFDGAVEILLQPFSGDNRIGVIIQCFIDTSDGFYLLEHCADVMADKDNGAIFIDFCQQFIETGFETLVDIRAWLVENQDCGVGDDGTSQ